DFGTLKIKTDIRVNPKQYFRRQKADISYTSIPLGYSGHKGNWIWSRSLSTYACRRPQPHREGAAAGLSIQILTLSRDIAFLGNVREGLLWDKHSSVFTSS